MTIAVKNDLGTITMQEDLIATVAGYAAVENYGIVGMCARTAGDAIVELFGGENMQKAVLIVKEGRIHEHDDFTGLRVIKELRFRIRILDSIHHILQ